MTIKTAIPALVACIALGGAGAAAAQENRASTYGAGAAAANSEGASAGGVSAGHAASQGYMRDDKKRDRRASRSERRSARTESPAAPVNSATTYGSGAVSTTRGSANVGVTTGGSASGTGPQSAGSTIDAYGETTRDGSSADLYGGSSAQSGEQ